MVNSMFILIAGSYRSGTNDEPTWVWNDLLLGLVLTQSDATRPVMPVLTGLQSTEGGGASYTIVLTAAILVSLPTGILFLISQRSFSRGLSLGQY